MKKQPTAQTTATKAQILAFAKHLKSNQRGIKHLMIGQGYREEAGENFGDILCELPFAFPELWEFRTIPDRTHLRLPFLVGNDNAPLSQKQKLQPICQQYEATHEATVQAFFGINEELYLRIFTGKDNYYGVPMNKINLKMVANSLITLASYKYDD